MEDKPTNKYTLGSFKDDAYESVTGLLSIAFWVIVFTHSCKELKTKASEPAIEPPSSGSED
jgi:hypothetical protein